MRVETKKEMREVEVSVFVAEDGKQFDTEMDCIRYEEDLERVNKLGKLKPYIVEDLDEQIPLHADASYYDGVFYTWFKANNKEDYEVICDLLDERFGRPSSYPYYFCVETEREFAGEFDDYYTTLDMCKDNAKIFFERFGIKILFEEV